MTASPDLRPATAADIRRYMGDDMRFSCRAIVADLDGEILGAGGVYYCGPNVVAFSQFDDRMRAFPFTMARATLMIMDIVRRRHCIAFADDKHPGSEDLLRRIGFKHVEGRVYEWKP